jgi:hypothetical protein
MPEIWYTIEESAHRYYRIFIFQKIILSLK